MRAEFAERYRGHPSVHVTSPGRVNLIGDHTDYSLLPVLPMAIDRSISLLAGPGEPGRLRAASLTHPGTADVRLDRPLPAGEGWLVYLFAALTTLGRRVELGARGADLLIDADLPSTGGLSSSAALLVGVLETVNRLWDLGLAQDELPVLAGEAENSMGLENGGMDQTVIALARAGHALRIEFAPLRWRHVPLPDDLCIIAAYSGETALKGEGANLAYNSAVAACRAATLVLADRLGIDLTDQPVALASVADHPDVEAAAAELPAHTTALAVAAQTGQDIGRIVQLTAKRLPDDLPLDVRSRAVHVLSEARRVDEAEAALLAGDERGFGRLLDASHASLRRFGTSSPALDHLTAAMRTAGALGARVTGAGFGGYAVAASPPGSVDAVIGAALKATGGPATRVLASGGVH
jgi:galactokinase